MFHDLWRRRPTRAVRWAGMAALLALLCAPACNKSAPANVAATVNNRAISYTELEKTYQQSQLAAPGQADEQTMAQKLEVLRGLIDSETMLQRAEKQGLLAGDADVEAKLTELKAPWTKEQFEQQLRDNLGAAGRNLTAAQVARLDSASETTLAYPYWHQRQFTERSPSPVK